MNQPVCKCGQPAVVGIGSPPEWLCLADYETYLAGMRAALADIRKAIGMANDA